MKNEESKQGPKTRWYVYPTDGGHTNNSISMARNGEGFIQGVVCADKKRRNLWETDLEFIHQLVARQNVERTSFVVYMSYADNKPQLFDLGWTKKKNNCPLIVIAHPITGEVGKNTKNALTIFHEICGDPKLDIAPWFPFEILQVLDSADPKSRQKGIYICLSMIKKSEGLWLYGDRISDGMKTQVILALIQGIPVKAHSKGTARDLKAIKGGLIA